MAVHTFNLSTTEQFDDSQGFIERRCLKKQGMEEEENKGLKS